jgi:hypothetical protein
MDPVIMSWNHQQKKRRKIVEKLIKNFLFHINRLILNEKEGKIIELNMSGNILIDV